MIIVFSAFVFSYYFVAVAGIPSAIKKGFKMKPGIRIKPFDCVTCLSVWMAGLFYFLPVAVVEFIGIVFSAGLIGNIDWPLFITDCMRKIVK